MKILIFGLEDVILEPLARSLDLYIPFNYPEVIYSQLGGGVNKTFHSLFSKTKPLF